MYWIFLTPRETQTICLFDFMQTRVHLSRFSYLQLHPADSSIRTLVFDLWVGEFAANVRPCPEYSPFACSILRPQASSFTFG
jgi:hypothetical protein